MFSPWVENIPKGKTEENRKKGGRSKKTSNEFKRKYNEVFNETNKKRFDVFIHFSFALKFNDLTKHQNIFKHQNHFII